MEQTVKRHRFLQELNALENRRQPTVFTSSRFIFIDRGKRNEKRKFSQISDLLK